MSKTLQIASYVASNELLQASPNMSPEGPFHLVNFLAFKKQAEYPPRINREI